MHLRLCLALLCASCAAAPRATSPLPGWERIRVQGDQAAYHHAGGGTIGAARHCGDADDVSLDVLTNHILMGVEQRRERGRTRIVVDGRAALRTQLEGRLDGVMVVLDLVILKKDGCTYDLYSVAPPALASARSADFERFVSGFGAAR